MKAANGPVAWQPRVVGMDAYSDVDLSQEKYLAVICSTWGDGDMPDSAVAFWNFLQSEQAPRLEATSYAVFGLGDRNYRRFCQASRNLDARFEALGAKRLLPVVACDTDYEAASQAWFGDMSTALQGLAGEGLPPAAEGNATVGASAASVGGSVNAGHNGSSANSQPDSQTLKYDRKRPFPAPLLENHPLNARESSKDTRHFGLSLLGSGLTYKAGDALGVIPRNDYNLVDRVILRLNALGNETVTVAGEPATLRHALLEKLDLRRASEALLHALLGGTKNPGERRRIEALLKGPESETTLEFLATRDTLDVMDTFGNSHPSIQDIVGALGKLSPRLYSIASSPLANPHEVHLCVGVQRQAQNGRVRRGVTSTFLAERVPLGMPVPVYVQPTSHFVLPAQTDVPLIMVGPGTGIAPFRAFLQERRALGDKGRNWLFYGDQKRSTDFLYSDELLAMEADGFLNRMSLAFSRDQEQKIYVQDRMLEAADDLYAWLEEGAGFYVCGDAKRMAKDVDAALHQVIERAGGKTPDQARDYVEKMKKDKRYARDVY
jgi:sulfite reductase (NADPH) flavoprotein alpha-component